MKYSTVSYCVTLFVPHFPLRTACLINYRIYEESYFRVCILTSLLLKSIVVKTVNYSFCLLKHL